MNSREAAGPSRPATSKATRRTMNASSKTNQQRPTQPLATSTSANKRGKKDPDNPITNSLVSRGHAARDLSKPNKSVIASPIQPAKVAPNRQTSNKVKRVVASKDDSSSSSQEMITTSIQGEITSANSTRSQRDSNQRLVGERETNIDRPQQPDTDDDESTTLLESCSSDIGPQTTSTQVPDISASITTLPAGWEERTNKDGTYYCHVATGANQKTRPTKGRATQLTNRPVVLYHDDEEINQSSSANSARRTSSDESDHLESGAALTTADDPTTISDVITFVVLPTGCCEIDETQLVTANSTKTIQKCILRLTGQADKDEASRCWGLDSSQPILMRLLDDHIQFSDMNNHSLLRSQPIQTIKTWAVDDDNNFAFVVEDQHDSFTRPDGDDPSNASVYNSVDYALLNGPTFVCYVFSSADDDDMSIKVANKLNQEISRYRELMSRQASTSAARLQQTVETNPLKRIVTQTVGGLADNDLTDADEDFDDAITSIDDGNDDDDDDDDDDDEDDQLGGSRETSMRVKYIGKVQVPRPMGIDVLNVAIDKSLADASKIQMDRLWNSHKAREGCEPSDTPDAHAEIGSPLIEAKIHVSPSSVIVENAQSGDIIVECRIRYLTFMGISRRDIRWCGFIMQNTTNKTFEAHCIECSPTAGHVCEAIQASCSRMYERMVKGQRRRQQVEEATSIIPKTSKIRDTLAKTFSKIKLTPIMQ